MKNSFESTEGTRKVYHFQNLDPENIIRYDVSQFEICNNCLDLKGQLYYELPDNRWRYLL